MERAGYNQLMSGAKYKPGDIVWTNDETFGPWPGKVLHVSDQILRIYPDVTRILHYVELYVKKDRDFHPEDEIWPFDDGHGKISAFNQVKLFNQAVIAAREDGEDMSIESEMPGNSEMDVENVSFCERQFLRNNLRSADAHEKLQIKGEFNEAIFRPFSCNSAANAFDMPNYKPCAQSKPVHNMPSYKVATVPSKSQFKETSTSGMIPNKDLNPPDVYEFTESEPMALNIGRRVRNVANISKTRLRRETAALGINIREQIPCVLHIPESSLDSSYVPLNLSTKRKIPLTEKRSRKAEHTLVKGIGKIPKLEPIVESRVDDKPAPLDISVKAKIPKKSPKASVSRRGRKSKKRRSTKKPTGQEKKSNDLPGEKTMEEQSEAMLLGMSSHVELVPRMASPQPNQKNGVGFLGLGGLGRKIVRKLIACDHDVTLWNRSFYKCYEMSDLGVHTKSTPEQVVNACDVTFCCVSDSTAVKEVYFAQNGGAKHAIREGKIFVVLTTIDPNVSSAIEDDVISKGGLYLEAPLFPAKGCNNTLMTAIGGNRSSIRACLPYFCCFIKDLFYTGPVPEGNKMILVMKTLSGVKIAALAESMALARRCEVPIETLFQIFKQTPLASPFLIAKAEAMLRSEPSEDDIFPLGHFSHDMTATLNLTSELDTPVIAAAKQVFLHSKLRGYTFHDVSAVYYKYLEP